MVAKIQVSVVRKVNVDHQGLLLVMILKSVLRYSLLITRPCFTRKATPPLAPVERSFFIVSCV